MWIRIPHLRSGDHSKRGASARGHAAGSGGANTFHETVLAGIPTLVWPVMGDQGSVANAVVAAGVGASVETCSFPDLAGARSLEHIADVTLPAMLSPADNPWKVAACRLSRLLASEDGVAASAAFVLGDR